MGRYIIPNSIVVIRSRSVPEGLELRQDLLAAGSCGAVRLGRALGLGLALDRWLDGRRILFEVISGVPHPVVPEVRKDLALMGKDCFPIQ